MEPLFLLRSLCDRDVHARLGAFLTDEYFPGYSSLIRQGIRQYWKRNRREQEASPSGLALLVLKGQSKPKQEILRSLLQEMGRLPLTPAPAVERYLQDYIRRQALQRIALEMQTAAEKPTEVVPSEHLRRLRDLTGLFEKADDRVLEYGQAPLDYWKDLVTGRVPTGIATLDASLRGGVGPGELAVVIGPWSGGKTASLVNLGAHGVRHGANVLHFTLEIARDELLLRYDMNAAGETDSIAQNPTALKLARKKFLSKGGGLIIHDCSHERMTPARIESLIEKYSAQRKVDLVLIDYLDLVYSDRGNLEGRFNVGDVYRETRRIASLFKIPIWTASQATREASRTGVFGGADVAEDISKMHTVDIGICLLQTPMERTQGVAWLKLEKGRTKSKRPKIKIMMDFDRMQWRELDEDPGNRSESAGHRSRFARPGRA